MTIFNPSQQKSNIRFILALTAIVLIGGTALVLQYNELAALRAESRELKNSIEKGIVENAELKSELYAMTDSRRLEEVATASALVLERRPAYYTYSQ
jgi:cell division protein FtsL